MRLHIAIDGPVAAGKTTLTIEGKFAKIGTLYKKNK